MLEIEAKLRVEDHDSVREALLAVGAELVGCYVESNHILDRGDGSLYEQGCGLRVRTVEVLSGASVGATVTFKGPVQAGGVKTREETEVTVSDADGMLRVFDGCGFVVVLSYKKRRERWTVDGCNVELDEVPMLGTFVEIEGPSEQAVQTVQRRVGLEGVPHVRDSYVRMLADRCDAAGRSRLGIDF
jgi:adenylate cyclase, class 2